MSFLTAQEQQMTHLKRPVFAIVSQLSSVVVRRFSKNAAQRAPFVSHGLGAARLQRRRRGGDAQYGTASPTRGSGRSSSTSSRSVPRPTARCSPAVTPMERHGDARRPSLEARACCPTSARRGPWRPRLFDLDRRQVASLRLRLSRNICTAGGAVQSDSSWPLEGAFPSTEN